MTDEIDANERKRKHDREAYRLKYASDPAFAERERERQRVPSLTPEQYEKKQVRSARRAWAGDRYVGVFETPEYAALVTQHLGAKVAQRRIERLEAYRDWSDGGMEVLDNDNWILAGVLLQAAAAREGDDE